MGKITYVIKPEISDKLLNELFLSAWDDHEENSFRSVLAHSLTYVCAFDKDRLVAFVNVAWDGGVHGFILDTTVHCDYQRQGIGTALLQHAATAASEQGLEWLHVDFEPHLTSFYRGCGYRSTEAGLLNLRELSAQI